MQFWINVLDGALIVAVFAASLSVILGTAGQLSIAPAGFGGIGGYLAGYLSAHSGVAFLPALAAGGGGALVCGVALGLPALRLSQEYLILLTLAFATVVVAVIEAIPALGGANGLLGIRTVHFSGALMTPTQWLPPLLIVTAITILFCWRLGSSPFGRVLRGIREDADATQALGKNVVGYKLTTFAWTSAVAGIAGVMLVYFDQIASPTSFDFSATTTIIAAVVIGGMGNLAGAVLGALVLSFIGPVLQKLVNLNPDTATLWQLMIYGLLLVLMMRLRPSGLIPEGASLRGVGRLLGRLRIPLGEMPQPRLATVTALVGEQAAIGDSSARETESRALLAAHGVTAHVPSVGAHAPRAAGDAPAAPGAGPEPESILVATGLVKHFGGIRAVQGLDVELATGRITALVGPNGAGKTTVFNLLTGRIRPDQGRVVLRGRDITGLPPHRIARLGMVRSFQDVRTLTRMSLLENVALAVPEQAGEHMAGLFLRPLSVRHRERDVVEIARDSLAFVGLEDRAADAAGALGYGDQKLLAIARLLATGGEVLLIDEPASGIDRANLEPVLEVIERLRDEGKTICLVEHNLDVVTRLSDHVLFMEQGRVTAQGTMAEITREERLAEVYFGRA